MKHVSWTVALVVGFAIGFFSRGALTGVPRGGARDIAAPAQGQPEQRPARPVEDPRAVYRVPVDDVPVKGPADALVTIVQSSDFECPFCKRVLPTLKQLEEAFPGKIRFAVRHNPLPFHPRAMPSAIAAEEARAQGGDAKFWTMHDKLFELAPALDQASIEKAAQALGLDVAKLKDALTSNRHRERIERDQRLVQSLGATGTPAFFINGRKLSGAQPFEAFRAIVEEELKRAEALVQAGTPAAQVYARIIEKGASAPVYASGSPGPTAAPDVPAAKPVPAAVLDVQIRPDDPVLGNPKAPVTIVVFSDFQCPFSARVAPTLEEVQRTYGDKVKVVWKHQPLSFHQQAIPAAEAAEAAREQGKFWQMHDRLFAAQRELAPDTYERLAKEVGLDLRRFQEATRSGKHRARIQEDQQLAMRVGANGTPTMFVNGERVVGAVPLAQIKEVIDRKLSAR